VRHTLTIDRDARAPGKARAAVEDLVGDIDERLVPSAKLLVSELMTNAVKYGGAGAVRVEFDAPAPDRLRCEVIDEGDGFTPVARARPKTDVGGWGLHLVDALSESWGVHEGSTHVWFELTVDDGA
jgi:anti-sigma regulatory factor (Ser/Thr protein kinase)